MKFIWPKSKKYIELETFTFKITCYTYFRRFIWFKFCFKVMKERKLLKLNFWQLTPLFFKIKISKISIQGRYILYLMFSTLKIQNIVKDITSVWTVQPMKCRVSLVFEQSNQWNAELTLDEKGVAAPRVLEFLPGFLRDPRVSE